MYEKNIGKYRFFYLSGQQNVAAGKIKKIVDNHLILNPFQGGRWGLEKGIVRKIICEDAFVYLTDIAFSELTTLKSLENYCKFQNRVEEEKRKVDQIVNGAANSKKSE